MTDAVPDGPRNVLLVGPDGPATNEACVNLISSVDPEATNLLSVTFNREPDELVGELSVRLGRFSTG